MHTRFTTRMKKTSSMGQVTQEKSLVSDQELQTPLACSDVSLAPRKLISSTIEKRTFHTPNLKKLKVLDKPFLSSFRRASEQDPSINSISISLESSETPEQKPKAE